MTQPKIISIVYCQPWSSPTYIECAFLDFAKAIAWAKDKTTEESPVRKYYATEVEVLDWEDK